MTVMTHVVFAQKLSWVAELARPPVLSTPMFLVLLSEERRTW
ncbi:hypothetical protein GCM10009848_20690 [Micromonospora lupini]